MYFIKIWARNGNFFHAVNMVLYFSIDGNALNRLGAIYTVCCSPHYKNNSRKLSTVKIAVIKDVTLPPCSE
jgi:hypothetical protein